MQQPGHGPPKCSPVGFRALMVSHVQAFQPSRHHWDHVRSKDLASAWSMLHCRSDREYKRGNNVAQHHGCRAEFSGRA